MEQVESRAAARTGGPSRPVHDPGAGEFVSPADEPAVREVGATGRPVVRPARLVFDDSVTAEARNLPGSPGTGIRRDRRAEQHALASMNHTGRSVTTYLIILILVVLVGAIGFLAARSPARHPAHSAESATTSTSRPTSAHHSGSSQTTKTKAKHPAHVNAPAPPARYVATSSTTTSATYTVAPSSFTLTIAATGPCWVQATAEPGGASLWEGVVPAGGSQNVSARGATSVLLGAAGAALSIDGVPVVLPSGSATPFTATFQPSASTSTA
ncbi:MAG: DUF4115 domain-containing protein [Acidimicrobiales bacterium]|nr:DUF4115 domain-containing protein [Acidimicrobiales bacterium]